MPPHGRDFIDRCPQPAYSQDDYARDRYNQYPGRGYGGGRGFPPPDMTGGYDATAQWDTIKDVQESNRAARVNYATSREAAVRSLDSMGTSERRYYTEFTGGMMPTDHARLKPMARTHQETAYEHAAQREALYGGAPLLYDTAASQREHHQHIEGHYRESDRAERNYAHHEEWEKYSDPTYSSMISANGVLSSSDPESTDVDAYGRPIPHGRRPMAHPYPYRDPTDDSYYSGEYGMEPPAFTTKIVPKKQKRRGR